jgi:hypothetical protein
MADWRKSLRRSANIHAGLKAGKGNEKCGNAIIRLCGNAIMW